MEFEKFIRDIPDFPKEGVTFKDITPLLNDAQALNSAADQMHNMVIDLKIDKVVGVDSRGFIFAPLLASKIGAGFVPVRKKGKLPYKTISAAYDLEYGQDVLEIHTDAIQEGENVLIHDDVLATGGTAKAVCELVEKLGGKVIQCNFLIELSFLNGANKIKDYPIKALLTY